jgi:hypothetical protein
MKLSEGYADDMHNEGFMKQQLHLHGAALKTSPQTVGSFRGPGTLHGMQAGNR